MKNKAFTLILMPFFFIYFFQNHQTTRKKKLTTLSRGIFFGRNVLFYSLTELSYFNFPNSSTDLIEEESVWGGGYNIYIYII